MAIPDPPLCDHCHERPATNHICDAGLGTTRSRSLCDICLQQDPEIGGLMRRFTEAIRVGHCQYCGGPAETGSGNTSSVTGDHFDLICLPCHQDMAEFIQRPENALLDFTPGDEEGLRQAAAHLADRNQRLDAFMRQRVSQRKHQQ